MPWILGIVLVAFLAISVAGMRRVWLVFAATPLHRICSATLFVTNLFVALTAIFGGVALAMGIDKFPAACLVGTPFRSYLIPGLILTLIVGGTASMATVAMLLRAGAATLTSLLAGAILLGWLAGERLILPSEAFPTQFSWLESIYIAAGLLMMVLAVTLWRNPQRTSPRSRPQ